VANLTVFLQRLSKGLAAKSLGGLPDRELLRRFAARHEGTAFEAIVRRHGPMVLRVCWRVLRQSQDAEDAFQATFLLLALNVGSVRKPDSLASWLHGSARRVALKSRTQRALRRRHEELHASAARLSADASAEQLRSALDEELSRLPEQWRLPFILCYLEGRTQDEAAAQLGWSTRTFRRRLDQARGELGRRLVRRGVALSAALSALVLSDSVVSATVPANLAAATVEAGARVAAGESAAGIVSADVLAVTQGVRTAMFTSKLKAIVGLLLLVGALTIGGWRVVADGSAGQPQESKPAGKTPAKSEETPRSADRDGPREIAAYRIITVTDETVQSAVLTPDGKSVITVTGAPGNRETRVKKWDAESGEIRDVILEGGNHKYTVALSTSGKQLAVADGFKKETEIHDITDLTNGPRLLHTLTNSAKSWAVAFAPGGKAVITGGFDGSVQVYDEESGQERWSKQAHTQPQNNIAGVTHVAFSRDGKRIVSTGTDKTVQIRDAADGSLQRTLEDHTGQVTAARFFPDGKRLVSGGYDHAIRIWDVDSGKELRKIEVAETSVRSLAVSPDGKTLAIGGLKDVGRTVLGLWDAETGKQVRALTGHEGGARSVAFSEDGTMLIAGGATGVGLWRLKPAEKK
jgi:RNA polymerase sigma factor (sigma-70 family)